MKILFFGDIVGRPGREALVKALPGIKKEYEPDLVFANGENLAHGVGFSKKTIAEICDAGVDFLTSGDHAFSLKEGSQLLEDKTWSILRPLNWPGDVPGRGYELILNGAQRILLINLIGRVFMRQDFDDPFKNIEELIQDYSLKGKDQATESVDAIIIDFHAEATSEKIALGWFVDGKVSALLGTHTHVPTSDERILPKGTAYITDLGMVGPQESVLGRDKDTVIKRYLTQRLWPMEIAQSDFVEINSVYIEIDDKSGLGKKIERVRKIVELD